MTDAPRAGEMVELAPGLRRIIAPNPSPMTYWGTNTYVLGRGAVTLVDPGPNIAAHAKAILSGLAKGETIARILVTHSHVDHSPLARPMAEAAGVPVYAYGNAEAGRSEVMRALVAEGLASGGEGVDSAFAPDICLADGAPLDIGNGEEVTAVWTPGHFANHLSFAYGGALLSGDHIMGWASTMISPPDGDLSAFFASCEMLLARGETTYYPGHGAPVADGPARTREMVAHRKAREAEILASLAKGAKTPRALTQEIYQDTPPALHGAAMRNVFAHLIDLTNKEKTAPSGALSEAAEFHLT